MVTGYPCTSNATFELRLPCLCPLKSAVAVSILLIGAWKDDRREECFDDRKSSFEVKVRVREGGGDHLELTSSGMSSRAKVTERQKAVAILIKFFLLLGKMQCNAFASLPLPDLQPIFQSFRNQTRNLTVIVYNLRFTAPTKKSTLHFK